MDITKFQIPSHWPSDAKSFADEAISEIKQLKSATQQALRHILTLEDSLKKAHAEIRELKERLGTNSSNSGLPPSKDPPGTPSRSSKPTGRKLGAQAGHDGSGRKLFPPEKITRSIDVFPQKCPVTDLPINVTHQHSRSVRRFHQVDLPEVINVEITEIRLHTCICPCGCGKSCSATVPAEYGNTAVGPRLKAVMALLASRFRLSKTLIRELLIDVFGPDVTFSTGCISEAEAEMTEALSQPYNEAMSHVKQAEAAHVDESSWYLKHKIQWLWVAVTDAVTIFHIDPNRSQEAFERFLGRFEGMIISDRFSAYAKLSPEVRQLCWAHLMRDFRKMVDRQGGAEHIGTWALREIETMFGLWRAFLEGELSESQLRQEFVTIRARFSRLLQLGQTTQDTKAIAVCKNLRDLWPALWNFLQKPQLLQPTNNRAEQAIRQAVIARTLSLGSQSDRGLRFTERMLTVVTTLRKQGRRVLTYLQDALHCFRMALSPPSLLVNPSG